MYKMMIVDDEYLSRYSLRALINKKFNNIEIVGEAENGRQAVEFYRRLHPEITIMDIKMPGINGIDASVEILNEFPDANILILTAYDNFEFIKRALDIGVKGYILKPVKESEVVEKINKILNNINERLNQNDFMEMVESKIKIVKPFMEDELISAFVTGNFDTVKVNNYIDFLQEEIEAGYFMLVSSGQSFSKEINDCIRNRIQNEKMLSILTRHLPLMKKCFFRKNLGNTIVIFIPADIRHLLADVSKEAIMIAQEIKRKLKVIGDIDATIGIGDVYHSIKDFHKSYSEAAIAHKKAVPGIDIQYFGLLEQGARTPGCHVYPIEMEGRFTEQLKTRNITNAKSYANEILENILENTGSLDIVKEYVGEFFTIFKRTLLKIGISTGNSTGTGILSELGEISSMEELHIWCMRILSELLELAEEGSNKSTDVIGRIFEYTNRNFNKDITLDTAASEAGITPQYLSKVFKEKYGTNFIDYITKKRLEYAEELLKKSDKSIKEISKIAGYEDANYFCRLFRKDTGLSPKEYRIKVTRGEY